MKDGTRRILLIGNYPPDNQPSMDKYADLLAELFESEGWVVELLKPNVLFGKLSCSGELGKWVGYIDKFLVFPLVIRRRLAMGRRPSLVYICDHSNAMYATYCGAVPVVATCHDLIAIRAARGEIAGRSVRVTGRLLQSWIAHGLRCVSAIISVSSQSDRELRAAFPKIKAQCFVVPNALNYPYRPMAKDETGSLLPRIAPRLASKPFVFHVSGNGWYKNRFGALRIFHKALSHGAGECHMIMAGQPLPADILDYIEKHKLGDRIIFAGFVSNEELNALYSAAEVFLFPSLMEGFGWPIIEAMASGAVVITSNRPPMSELVPNGSPLIDPDDEEAAALTLVAFLRQSCGSKSQARGQALACATDYLPAKMRERLSLICGQLCANASGVV